ncbi:MAG: hypothetical protein AAF404_04245 [Pseudomonadota bacterium]
MIKGGLTQLQRTEEAPVANPESTRKTQRRTVIDQSPVQPPTDETTHIENNKVTTVLMSVARSGCTPLTQIFPKMAVSAANTADSSAQPNHAGITNLRSPGWFYLFRLYLFRRRRTSLFFHPALDIFDQPLVAAVFMILTAAGG